MRFKFALMSMLLIGIVQVSASKAAVWQPLVTAVAGGSGQGSDVNQLMSPYGIALGPDGTLFVADSGNHRVQMITFTAGVADEPITVAGGNGSGSLNNQLSGPRNVTLGPDGALYIVDHNNHRIQRLTRKADGTFNQAMTVAGGNGIGPDVNQLQYPYGIAVDAGGSLYIADTGNHRIQKVTFDSDGVPNIPTTVAGGNGLGRNVNQLQYPRGIVLDSHGSLYIADTNNHRIQRVTFDDAGVPKQALTIAGGNGAGSGVDQFSQPYDLALASNGDLYVADTNNHRIQRISFDSTRSPQDASTVFGNDQGSGDDQVNSPRGLMLGTDGTAYISDFGNHRVLQVSFDMVNPTIQVAGATGSRVGASATIGYTCTDTGGSGIDTCTARLDNQSVSSGDALDTRSRGTQTLIVTATDNAGNATTDTRELHVHGTRELTGDYAQATAVPGAVARLYMATFNREPDGTGFSFWSAQASTDLQTTASFFATSPEFTGLYGDTTNNEFIDLMYTNVMTRAPEPVGLAYWLDQLDDGMTQAQLLLWFSESPEFKTLTHSS